MTDWIEGFQASIDYIEQNLTKELDIGKIAKQHYLRFIINVFSVQCAE